MIEIENDSNFLSDRLNKKEYLNISILMIKMKN